MTQRIKPQSKENVSCAIDENGNYHTPSHIAIISKDEELLRLVELEADFIGASSSSFSEVPSNLLKFDVVD